MKIHCTANQKGGVGKSTFTVHCVFAAVERKLRVLLLDFDGQGNTSSTFPKRSTSQSTQYLKASDLFREDSSAPVEALSEYLSIIRSDPELDMIRKLSNDELKMPRSWLKRLSADYDVCFIDTPPALSDVLGAALTAADTVVTPMQIGDYEMQGVEKLFNTIKKVRRELNPKLRHTGILLIKTNTRSREEIEAVATLREKYGGAILQGSLPERAAVKAAIARKKPVWANVRGSSHRKAATEWQTMCNQIIDGVLNAKREG